METKKTQDDSNPEPCLIVGIGASAGGLNSLECFLRALPIEFGFAIVFMQHLSPTHKSLLPELLRSGRPDLQIIEITSGLPALPGKLYLCPPRQDLKIQKGVFTATSPGKNAHLLIDEFFTSLAEEYGEKAVAVVFSGAGTDGARGTIEIRKRGGAVFVQNPATAEFAEMPLSAINAGQVDKVLPPEDIAREILKLHCAAMASADDRVITPEEFQALYRLITEKTGYKFNYYKQSVVTRRTRRRMHLREIPSVRDYIQLVAENDAEASALASDLMIGVTSFFRDPLAWKALRIGVIRKIAAEGRDDPVRVWTPACATGEESYSIAMMLHTEFELAGRKREIQVFATDVNDRTLEKAREGKYPSSIAADIPPDFMRQFVVISEDGLSATIGKTIREHVLFARQDLLTDPPFSRLDLVICRNLLIYLEPDAQEKCLGIFHYALRDGGCLFLGNAESAGRNSALFKSLSHKKCRIYQKLEAPLSSKTQIAVPFAAEPSPGPKSKAALSATRQQSDADLIQGALIEEYAPTAVAINKNYDIVYHNGLTNRYLQHPRGAPTQNLLELLPESLRNRIRGAVYRASKEARSVSIRADYPAPDSDSKEKKNRCAFRISKLGQNLFLIVFLEKGLPKSADAISLESAPVDESVVHQLESELSATRTDLQMNIEQLKSLNEELQSSNEEMQAANEELETSREELQSLNEELITVNAQLQSKMEEQEDTNNDLSNFLSSTNIPTIFLDHMFRVRRFTPAMSRLLKLIPSDAGRPIMDMSQENLGPDLISDAKDVLEHLAPVKREIAVKGNWYIRTALPYRTLNNSIEGVVVTYSDVTDLKLAEESSKHLASFPQLNPNPIIEVDSSGKVSFSNPAAQKILERIGMDKGDPSVFFPPDFVGILGGLEKKEESTLYREVSIKDRVFGETVHLSPQFNVVRIYAFEITKRKRAEDGLVRAKEEWERTFDSVPDLIAILDNQHRVMRVNQAMARRLGLTPDQCIGLPCYKAVHGTSGPPSFCPHSRTLADGREHIEEVHEDSLGGDFLVSTTPLYDAQGKMMGSVHVAHDITKRKRSEEALRESEQRLARAQEIAQLGSWELDLLKNELSWSDEVYRIFGLQPREFGASYEAFLKRVHPDDRAAVDAAYSDSIKEGRNSYEIIHRVVRKVTGEIRWVHEKCRHVRDSSGNIIRSLGMVHDITTLRKAEENIRRQNAILEGINLIFKNTLTCRSEEELAQACLAIIEEVTQSKFGFIGEIGTDGFLHDIAISDPGWELCTMHDKSGHQKPPGNFPVRGIYGRVISDGKGFFTNDPSSHRDSRGTPEGHPPLKAFLGVPLIHGNKIVGMIAVGNREWGYRQLELDSLEALAPSVVESLYRVRAVEELRKLTEELKRSNEDLQQFARFASHDLQAPLKTVEGFVKLFNKRYKGKIDEQSDNLLGYIVESVRDMQTLIKDLLEFSRLEIGSIQLKAVDTTLSLTHALANLKAEMDESGAEVTYDEHIPGVMGDQSQMTRLFQNLISNAIKFHGEDPPRIHISVQSNDGEWVFSVRDNGIGIDPKHRDRIFDIFQRLHGKSEFPGTGMGLAMCKRIVERMGGRIWVESESGKGSTFFFTIPVQKGQQ